MHTDGTKCNFEEVGGFQLSTGSGSFTLGIETMRSGEADSYFETFKHMLEAMSSLVAPEGIETMRSGEADSYFETFKHMLEAMSSLVAPEEHADQDMREVLTSFGALMTDNTIMNSAFF